MVEEKKADLWDRIMIPVLIITYLIGIAICLATFGWQVVHWLKQAQWTPLPFRLAFDFLQISTDPVYNPQQWLGVAKIFQYILELPLSICLPAVIIGIVHGFKYIIDSESPKSDA